MGASNLLKAWMNIHYVNNGHKINSSTQSNSIVHLGCQKTCKFYMVNSETTKKIGESSIDPFSKSYLVIVYVSMYILYSLYLIYLSWPGHSCKRGFKCQCVFLVK